MTAAEDFLDRLRRLAADDVVPASVHHYGDLPDQVADLRVPAGDCIHPMVILLHGGFWRARWKRDLMAALAVDLAHLGWATWNIEYRRVGAGGGVPQTLEDVLAAYDHLAHIDAPIDLARVVVLGHSAGGQLALWLAAQRPLLLTVSLAGVSCLAEAAELLIGKNAVRDFCGGLPAQVRQTYALADPVSHLPLGVRQLLVHGDRDDEVPVELSERWAQRSRASGDECELVVLPGVDHFALIDPTTGAWKEISRRLPGQQAAEQRSRG